MLASNTSTLVLLAKINCLEEFIKISPKIEIPVQVRRESLFDQGSYYARIIGKLIKTKKIKVISINNNKLRNILKQFNLDEGEAATYVLFDSKKHRAIMTDDGELIKLCKLQNIGFICAMAIVIVLYEKKILSKSVALNNLNELHKVGRYSEKIYRYFRGEVK